MTVANPMVAQQIVARYRAGETGNALCREFHMGYLRLRTLLDAFGVERHPSTRKSRDMRARCSGCDIILEEAAAADGPGRDGLCADCTWLEQTGEHFSVPFERFNEIVEGVLG